MRYANHRSYQEFVAGNALNGKQKVAFQVKL